MVGFAEFFSLLIAFVPVADMVGGARFGGADLAVVSALLLAAVAIRVVVATEYARLTDDGLEWRSLFRSYRIGWASITEARLGNLWLFPYRGSGFDCIEVEFVNGATRRLRASVGCSRQARAEFILLTTARLHPQP
ncbi:MAG TPA: hypothetical protein DCR14_17625 [Acidimicrobiaceae bacterium]|nr:hypothetical protein [Acidimicrobiaceae bacterium]